MPSVGRRHAVGDAAHTYVRAAAERAGRELKNARRSQIFVVTGLHSSGDGGHHRLTGFEGRAGSKGERVIANGERVHPFDPGLLAKRFYRSG